MDVGSLSATEASYSDEGLVGAGEGYGCELGAVPEDLWYPGWSEEITWGADGLTTAYVQEDAETRPTWPKETWGNTWSEWQPTHHLEWHEGTLWTPTTPTTTLPSSRFITRSTQHLCCECPGILQHH